MLLQNAWTHWSLYKKNEEHVKWSEQPLIRSTGNPWEKPSWSTNQQLRPVTGTKAAMCQWIRLHRHPRLWCVQLFCAFGIQWQHKENEQGKRADAEPLCRLPAHAPVCKCIGMLWESSVWPLTQDKVTHWDTQQRRRTYAQLPVCFTTGEWQCVAGGGVTVRVMQYEVCLITTDTVGGGETPLTDSGVGVWRPSIKSKSGGNVTNCCFASTHIKRWPAGEPPRGGA